MMVLLLVGKWLCQLMDTLRVLLSKRTAQMAPLKGVWDFQVWRSLTFLWNRVERALKRLTKGCRIIAHWFKSYSSFDVSAYASVWTGQTALEQMRSCAVDYIRWNEQFRARSCLIEINNKTKRPTSGVWGAQVYSTWTLVQSVALI